MNIKGKNGMVECVVLPIEQNHFVKGEKGVYVNYIGFELTTKREGSKDTHLFKQSLPKEIREKMTEEELKAMPILGNHSVWSENFTPDSVSSTETLNQETDDLPF
jgi:hypothetical protein